MRLTQYDFSLRGLLLGWTIYAPTTKDFPGHYVVRAWTVGPAPGWPFRVLGAAGEWYHFTGCLCATLDEARANVGPEFTRFFRAETDDPVIIESWL